MEDLHVRSMPMIEEPRLRTFSNTRCGPSSSPRFRRTSRKAAASFLRFSISSAVGEYRSAWNYDECSPFSPSAFALSNSSASTASSSSPNNFLSSSARPSTRTFASSPKKIALRPDYAMYRFTRCCSDRTNRERFRGGLDLTFEALCLVLLGHLAN